MVQEVSWRVSRKCLRSVYRKTVSRLLSELRTRSTDGMPRRCRGGVEEGVEEVSPPLSHREVTLENEKVKLQVELQESRSRSSTIVMAALAIGIGFGLGFSRSRGTIS